MYHYLRRRLNWRQIPSRIYEDRFFVFPSSGGLRGGYIDHMASLSRSRDRDLIHNLRWWSWAMRGARNNFFGSRMEMDGSLRVIQRLTRACVYISNPSPIIVLEESLPLLFPQQQQRGLRTFSLEPHPLTFTLDAKWTTFNDPSSSNHSNAAPFGRGYQTNPFLSYYHLHVYLRLQWVYLKRMTEGRRDGKSIYMVKE